MYETLIHSPFPRDTTQGNTITADRLKRILLKGKIQVGMSAVRYTGEKSACFIALNAWRSASEVAEYRCINPEGRVIIIITGSDINNDEMIDAQSPTRKTMEVADALVMLHDQELYRLPRELQKKCHIIYPSVSLPEGCKHEEASDSSFIALMAGNLRPVKHPLLAIEACKKLNLSSRVHVCSYGSAEPELQARAELASRELASFSWLGMVGHRELLQKMKGADVLLNTSLGEGAPNAICEAISMGLPVIASDIGGNQGMLGKDYAGYFPAGDAVALADLLEKAAEDRDFYQLLKRQILQRAPLFSYETESRLWIELLNSLEA